MTSTPPPSAGTVPVAPAPRRGARRKRPWLWPALLLLGAGGAAAYFLAPKAPPLTEVQTVLAAKGDLVRTVTGSGTAKAETSRNLSFSVAGTVAEVLVAVGDTVEKGQLLARLDTSAQQREIESAESGVRSAEADLRRAEAEVQRAQGEVTRAQGEVPKAQAELERAQAEVERAQAAERDLQRDSARSTQTAQLAVAAAQEGLRSAESRLSLQRQLLAAGAVSAQEVRSAETERAEAARKLQQAQTDLAFAAKSVSSAGLIQARAGVETARASLEQTRNAVGQARIGVTQAEAGVETARAGLAAARLKVANLQKALADTELRAPSSGVVSALNITVGNPASTTAPAAELTDPSRLYLEVPFDETRSPELQRGQAVKVQFDALPGETVTGQIGRVDPVAQASGQVASVKARIPLEGAQKVKPGYTGLATVTLETVEDATLVPLEATLEEAGENYVWTVRPAAEDTPASAHRVRVTVTARSANEAAVTGIQPGDRLVSPAPSDLTEGQPVQVAAGTPADAAGAGEKAKP
ncbi:efflux RND transporter periplasmic adaptor subunit [Deinococcus lacus]|uniref:Efflux RND transporter periplasmic adaptor subunit n=1 Tax=Deinococcus lacus TaxID=392561 RepID=A0ABW1YFB4_9DEIO